MKSKLDYILQMIQLYAYKLPTVKVGNIIMDFRMKYTLIPWDDIQGQIDILPDIELYPGEKKNEKRNY